MSEGVSAPAISVAMSVYNDDAFLTLAIESILAQTFGDFEFLIVNDGSTDRSGAIIDNFAARDSRIRAIHQSNRGLVPSLNRLLDEARAPLIARMDGDDISLPVRFAAQVAFLAAHPDHGAVGSWVTCIDESGSPRPGGGGEKPLAHADMLASLEHGPLFSHPSVMMRRDLVRAAGGYRAAYVHCEDYDLWLRLAGETKLANLRERLVLYRLSDSQVSSRHAFVQQVNAAIAYLAYCERQAGRVDPTEGIDRLPGLDGIDALFGRPGLSRALRRQIAPTLLHSPDALRSGGTEMLIDLIREGDDMGGLWRTAARLLMLGEPTHALRMAATLAIR
jgi:glycosyltransferase involved in cell wall biosynthesis